MTTTTEAGAAPARGAVAPSALYRAVWRWHFYAGLFVLPFMILLAVTGGLYLYKDEINDLMHGDLRIVEPGEAALAPSALAAAAVDAVPGEIAAYHAPAAPDRSAQVKVRTEDGKQVVFVNQYTGEVLGHFWDGGFAGSPALWVIRKVHSLDYFGWVANRVIEMVAGWAVVLVVTGLYLWWPRGRGVGVLKPRATKGRALWRDLHAVTGAYAAVFIVFLAVTGLPWSGFWGSNFYDLSYKLGIGMPDGYWSDYPVSDVPLGDALDRAPWALENQPLPLSVVGEGGPIGLDAAVRKVEEMGIAPGYALDLPATPDGVYTASVYPDDISGERVIHLDQYSGAVLFDMGFADLGALGMAAEWGVSVHMGQEFGGVNLALMTFACIAIVLMSVSAVAMWWKRRPQGSLGAPKPPADWRVPKVILFTALAVSVFFPLVGLSLGVMLLIDLVLPRAIRARVA